MSPRWILVAGVVVVALFFLAMFAPALLRSNPLRPRTLNDVALPCVRITEGTGWELLQERSQLSTMSSGRYLQRRGEPILIDAQLRLYETSNVTMKQSALGLMFTGPKMLDLTYDLHERTDRTPDDARSLLVDAISWSSDEERRLVREEVGKMSDLSQMVARLRRERDEALKPRESDAD
ncbi:MAG: hypothetical protein U0939_25770 [Pirellulales bacterium]